MRRLICYVIYEHTKDIPMHGTHHPPMHQPSTDDALLYRFGYTINTKNLLCENESQVKPP